MLRGLADALSHAGEKDFHLVRTTDGWAAVYTVEGEDGEPMRVLDAGGAWQSATYLGARRFEPVFSYYRAFDIAFETGIPLHRALMLGGGGCAWPKHAVATRPELAVDVVEQDPRVIDIARRFFFVDDLRGGLALIAAEGRRFLERNGTPYDAILNDAFHGAEPACELATVEAAQAISRSLSPGGVYLANIVSREQGADLSFLRSVVGTLRAVFPSVQIIPCPDAEYSDEDNFLVVAAHRRIALSGALPYDEAFPTAALRDHARLAAQSRAKRRAHRSIASS